MHIQKEHQRRKNQLELFELCCWESLCFIYGSVQSNIPYRLAPIINHTFCFAFLFHILFSIKYPNTYGCMHLIAVHCCNGWVRLYTPCWMPLKLHTTKCSSRLWFVCVTPTLAIYQILTVCRHCLVWYKMACLCKYQADSLARGGERYWVAV